MRDDDNDSKSVATAKTDDSYTPFPTVLYSMVKKESKRGKASPVRWVCGGEAFLVENNIQPQLNNVLKKYFNHGRYTSLQRQLNMYGFKKHFSGKYEGAFFHPSFHRDKTDNLDKIKRRPPPGRLRGEGKLGTRKRKVKRRNSEASESSSLIREAALVKNNGSQETYYYGSDISTANENSTLGGDNDHVDSFNNETDNVQEPPRRSPYDEAHQHDAEGDSRMGGRLGLSDIGGQKKRAPTNKIILPFSLKKVMLSTWENINQRQIVQDLPATITVKKVLNMYVEAKLSLVMTRDSRSIEDRESIRRRKVGCRDMAEGIALFFDKALETRLLYGQELPQFKGLSAFMAEKRLSEVYGCEHLLRLLLRLPDILAECVSDDKRKHILHDTVEFVRFLHQHQEAFFTPSFRKLTDTELDELANEKSASS